MEVPLRLDGRLMREAMLPGLRSRADAVALASGQAAGLGVILVGDDAASELYVRNKVKLAADLGIFSQVERLPRFSTTEQVLAAVFKANHDVGLDAFLVQLPLPAHIDTRAIVAAIDPARDVDGITPTNAGRLGGPDGVIPCTPQGCLKLIELHRPSLRGLEAVVVGRSAIVGRPMAQLLAARDATVTLCHRHTVGLAHHVRRADVLVAATGVPHLIQGDQIKAGATVIDVGLSHDFEGGVRKLRGDVEPDGAHRRAGALTPVPGGVGPMTLAMLMANTVMLAERRVFKQKGT